jgi:hypothetical protein
MWPLLAVNEALASTLLRMVETIREVSIGCAKSAPFSESVSGSVSTLRRFFRTPVLGDTGKLMSKQVWFDRGANALGQAAPKYRGAGYACPLCLRLSRSPATFTLEDVPPRSVGGRPLLLTCEGCNSLSGHTCDWHWANFWALEGFVTGDMRGPVDVQFTYEDLRSVAELSKENGSFTLKIIREASNPESVKETERLVGEAVKMKGRPEPMGVTFHRSQFDERLLRLSVLRAAYLTGIAVAGYRWIPILNPIRCQILDTTIRDASLSQLIRYEQEHSRDRRALAVIHTPVDMRNFCVGFGRWTVFLPWERESVLYQPEKLAGQRIEFKGSAYEWPTAPTFGIECPPH